QGPSRIRGGLCTFVYCGKPVSSGRIRPMIIKRMKLGELLLESKKISPEQLQRALDEQLKTHKRLGEVLCDLGIVDQETLVNFLSDQLKIPRMDLRGADIDKNALES